MADNDNSSTTPSKPAIADLIANNPLLIDSNPEESDQNPTATTNIDNDDAKKKADDMLKDLESESITPDDNNYLTGRSVTSGHLMNDQENLSTPNILDEIPKHDNQGPTRSMSESVLVDHPESNEQAPTLPVQQDENSTEDFTVSETKATNDTDVINEDPSIAKTETNTNAARPPSETKNNLLEETTSFPETSVARTQSSTSKQSRQAGDDDNQQIALPTETNVDTNPNNQEETPVARPSSLQRKSSATSVPEKNEFATTEEQENLITAGESLQIPENVVTTEGVQSPPPLSPPPETGVKRPSDTDAVSVKSRQSSSTSKNQEQTTSASSKKQDVSSSRKASAASQQQPTSKRGSMTSEKQSIPQQNPPEQQTEKPSSRKTSAAEPKTTESRVSSSTKQESAVSVAAKPDSRRSSTKVNASAPTSAKQKQEGATLNDQQSPSVREPSGQQSRKSSSKTSEKAQVAPVIVDMQQLQQTPNEGLSTSESDNQNATDTTLARIDSSTKTNEVKKIPSPGTTPREDTQQVESDVKAPVPLITLTDDETAQLSRPQSPNVEQLIEHNKVLSNGKKQASNKNEQKKKQLRPARPNNSAESSNYIPLVDDDSIDSASDLNIKTGQQKRQGIKPRVKDTETNTETGLSSKKSTPQKPLKATKPISVYAQPQSRRNLAKDYSSIATSDTDMDSSRPIVRRPVKQSKTVRETEDPVNVNVTVLVKNVSKDDDSEISHKATTPARQNLQPMLTTTPDYDRPTQSDTEQIVTEKQKKRRRPKRISRTTQTYECVFRRMEREEHEELRPTNDTEKNIQTRKSQLCQRSRSPKKHNPIYLSTDAFKIEEILPAKFPHSQQNALRAAMIARSSSPQNGKLLILRPTLPFHHTDAVSVQRVCLQYAIDLAPNENKLSNSPYAQRSKPIPLKPSEPTYNLPMIRSSSTTNIPTSKSITKEKPVLNKTDDRTHQRKKDGAV